MWETLGKCGQNQTVRLMFLASWKQLVVLQAGHPVLGSGEFHQRLKKDKMRI